jgi:acetyl esterase
MPLYPETKRFLQLLPEIDPEKIGVEGFRKSFRALTSFLPRQNVERVDDIKIPGSDREIPARVYYPKRIAAANSSTGCVVYFHGGGFVIGDIESYDPFSRMLANESQCVVVSVDYRLAPENKFPAAVVDAFDATSWVTNNVSKLGTSIKGGVAVAGDSAGGNLATVSALMCKDKRIDLKAQVLLFPYVSIDFVSRSSIEFSEKLFLDRRQARWFARQYLSKMEDALNPKMSPILWENFTGLTPCLIMSAEYDPLRDQGEAYADTLALAGVEVTSIRVRGVTHGYIGLPETGANTYAMIGGYLKNKFGL